MGRLPGLRPELWDQQPGGRYTWNDTARALWERFLALLDTGAGAELAELRLGVKGLWHIRFMADDQPTLPLRSNFHLGDPIVFIVAHGPEVRTGWQTAKKEILFVRKLHSPFTRAEETTLVYLHSNDIRCTGLEELDLSYCLEVRSHHFEVAK